MIDIHSHVLPGLDDGPQTLDQSIDMLRAAAAAGTTDLVATPHANLQFGFDPAEVERKLAELCAASRGQVRLHYGCDFHLSFDNIQDALANPCKYTIAHRRYLLVEFPDVLIAPSTDEVFNRMLEAGIVPVVTHPERNYLLHARVPQLERWVAAGCMMQITAQSFLGRFGPEVRRFADLLVRRGLAHFVASDAHDVADRTPRLDEARRYVARKYGEPWAEALFETNPRCAIEGAPLGPQPDPPPSRAWYRFWAS